MNTSEFTPSHDKIFQLDDAITEFIASLPFDDRLDQLTEHCEKHVHFEAYTDTFLLIDAEYLPPTHDENGYHHTPLTITGNLTDNLGVKSLRVTFSPETDLLPVVLDGFDGHYYLGGKDKGIKSLPALDAASLVLRSLGLDSTPLNKLHRQRVVGDELCHEVMAKALTNAADVTGMIESRSTLTRKSTAVIPGQEIEIRFGHRTVETTTGSEVYVILENAKFYEDLDTEEAYRLEIIYKDNPLDSEPNQRETTVQKSVRSDAMTIKSINLFHTDKLGTRTEMDSATTATLQQFVDAFEDLVDQTAA